MADAFRILLIEDSPADVALVQELLGEGTDRPYDVTHVPRLADGAAYLRRHEVDVAVLDLLLPDAEGLGAYRDLQEAVPELPVVVLSGRDDVELATGCVREGAQDYLLKGTFGASVLERALRHAVERSQLQRELRASERRFRNLVEHAADGVTLFDRAGRRTYHGPSYTRILGYAPDDGLGEDRADRVHPDDRLRVRGIVFGLAPGARAELRYRYLHAAGHWVWLDATVSNLLHDPAVGAFVLNYRDVTDEVRAAEERERLLKQERRARRDAEAERRRLERLVERAPTAMATVVGPDHRFELANAGFLETFGRSDLEGRPFAAAFPELDRQEWTTVLDRVRRRGEPFAERAKDLDVVRDGTGRATHLYLDVEFQPLLDADGEATGILLHAVDLTEAIRARQEAERLSSELRTAYDRTIEGWARALDMKDEETAGHSQRVTDMTVRLARHLGVAGEALTHLRRGALLHDIGKMGVPDEILLKPGRLTPEEFTVIQGHTDLACTLLRPIPFLRQALDIPYAHHEKWDGSGYPRGVAGDAIPFAARIFAVIDVFDALTNDRPYRPAWSESEALEHVRSGRGRHFDPQVVDAFLELHARGGFVRDRTAGTDAPADAEADRSVPRDRQGRRP